MLANTQTDEFIRISEEALCNLLAARQGMLPAEEPGSRREHQRWPFPGTVELWALPEPENDETEEPVWGRALNLGLGGVAALTDEPVQVGRRMAVAIHQPEATLYGEVDVRHCTSVEGGYCVGASFVL